MSIESDDQFQKVVTEGLVPRVEGSHICVSIVPRDRKNFIDAKFCVELGVMIMLDKPILAIVDPTLEVPEKLRLVADEIVSADINTEEGRALIATSVAQFGEKHKRSEEETP